MLTDLKPFCFCNIIEIKIAYDTNSLKYLALTLAVIQCLISILF